MIGGYLGDYTASSIVHTWVNAYDGNGSSITPTMTAASNLRVYKDGSSTARTSTSGYTLTVDFNSITGVVYCAIDTSDDTDVGFFAAGHDYTIVIYGSTINSQTVNMVVATFSIANRAVNRVTDPHGLLHRGTCQSGSTSGTIKLDANASSVNNWYSQCLVYITSGTGAGQAPRFGYTSYEGSNRLLYIKPTWQIIPDNTSTFEIYGWNADLLDECINFNTFLTSDRIILGCFTRSSTQAGSTTNTLVLNANSSSTDDIYVGNHVMVGNGDGSGQTRLITAYNGTTKVAQISPNWVVVPGVSIQYSLMGSQNQENVSVSTDGISSDSLSTGAVNKIADALLDRDGAIDTFTLHETHRLILSALVGLTTGGRASGASAPIFKSVDGSKVRITATTDSHGNRLTIVLDAS